MKNQDFSTTIVVDQTPEEVFNAINNVRRWWSENIEGRTDKLNSEFTHRDKYLHVTFKITQLTPRKIVWEVVDSHCNMFLDNLHEWESTRIVFELTEKADKTEIKFIHQGLIPKFVCYTKCSKAWAYFITTSLKNLIETGKGDPISTADASFTTSITVDKSPEEVYEAVNNVRGWWLNNIEGETDKINAEFKFYAGERLQFHFKIIEMIPYERIVWLVIDQNFKDTEEKEWKDTTLLFEISEMGGQTQLRFTHLGLVPPFECYGVCQNSWTNYIQISLFNFINKGIGQPNEW